MQVPAGHIEGLVVFLHLFRRWAVLVPVRPAVLRQEHTAPGAASRNHQRSHGKHVKPSPRQPTARAHPRAGEDHVLTCRPRGCQRSSLNGVSVHLCWEHNPEAWTPLMGNPPTVSHPDLLCT